VYADYDKRKPLCKVGWKSWQKYDKGDYSITYKKIKNNGEFCYKCGRPIIINDIVYEISYTTNKPNKIHIHIDC